MSSFVRSAAINLRSSVAHPWRALPVRNARRNQKKCSLPFAKAGAVQVLVLPLQAAAAGELVKIAAVADINIVFSGPFTAANSGEGAFLCISFQNPGES